MNRYIKQLLTILLAAGLCFSSLAQAADKEGVIRGLDLDNNRINVDVASYLLSPKLSIRNLDGGSSRLGALAVEQHVKISVDRRGTITDIWILPSQPEKRWRLGFSLEERDQ